MKEQSPTADIPTNRMISEQLERMLDSTDFRVSPQQEALLKFVVNRTLTGNADEIKAYTVATEVFGRGTDFDQSNDPVVSIQASRLRRAIKRYYLTAGKKDSIRIDIPKGTYVPKFNNQFSSQEPVMVDKIPGTVALENWPTVLIRSQTNLTGNPEDNYLSVGLTAELFHALSNYREIRVLRSLPGNPEPASRLSEIDYFVEGNVRRDATGIRVAIRLLDAVNGIQLWSGKYSGNLESAAFIWFQEKIAAEAAVCMAGDNAVIFKHRAPSSKKKAASELTTFEAMLRFRESQALLTPESMVRAIRALEHAAERDPDCGQLWSMLAAHYADNYGMEVVKYPTPLEKAEEFAKRGVILDPTHRYTRMIMAYVRLMQNKIRVARSEAEAAYHLCPNSIMALDSLGWLTALSGDWKRGINWIRKSINIYPNHRPWTRYALCLDCFRQGDYDRAFRESDHFMLPDLFWDQLLKASCLGHLGRKTEGQTRIESLVKLKPDFERRGRILIGRYVKFEDIADRIIEGLNAAGMKIA